MTLSQLLPEAKFLIVTTPQAVAQKVAKRSADMADKLKLEIAGVIENMAGFTTPSGESFPIFGEGGGQLLAEELDVPLLGQVPLTMSLREQSDSGLPVVLANPEDAAAQAIVQIAQRLIAMTPVALPMMAAAEPEPLAVVPPKPVGMSLPMA
jgi:ATP-binding protein involved in chromosome partitioning